MIFKHIARVILLLTTTKIHIRTLTNSIIVLFPVEIIYLARYYHAVRTSYIPLPRFESRPQPASNQSNMRWYLLFLLGLLVVDLAAVEAAKGQFKQCHKKVKMSKKWRRSDRLLTAFFSDCFLHVSN